MKMLDDMPWDEATKARLRKLLAENARQARAEMRALAAQEKRLGAKSEKSRKRKTA